MLQDTVGLTLPVEIDALIQQFGMPIPGMMAEARIGGFGLPFDIGLKYGEFLPELETLVNLQDLGLNLDYLVAGADVRFRLIEESGMVPMISVGGSVNYMEGGIGLTGLLSGSQSITIDLSPSPNVVLSMDDHSFDFTRNAFTIDLKAQAIKNLWILTPYAGFGASLGRTNVGGGMTARDFTIDGSEATAAEIEQLLRDLEDAGFEVPEETFSPEGFDLQAAADGWSFRACGGLSLNLFFIHADLAAMCDVLAGLRADQYVLTEIPGYLRGRAEGETPTLLARLLQERGVPEDAVVFEADPESGARHALGWAEPDDLVLLLTLTQRDAVLGLVREAARP